MPAQTHPVPVGEDVDLGVNIDTTITATVKGYKFNDVDGAYHYRLQAALTAPNTSSATVQIGDVHESLIILKP